MPHNTNKPDWWRENEALRDRMELPPYQPPRFLDDVYLHTVVEELEQRHSIRILLLGRNTRYGDDWVVTVDGEDIGSVGRHRDNNSNTVYELESREFRELIERLL